MLAIGRSQWSWPPRTWLGLPTHRLIAFATETERTLFVGFLPLALGQIRGFKTRFHLYTVPGQVLYDASRKLILKGVDGVLFIADIQIERMEANIESPENLGSEPKEHLSARIRAQESCARFRRLASVVQLVTAPVCGPVGRTFEACRARQPFCPPSLEFQ